MAARARLCRAAFVLLALLWVAALAILAIGTFGLFGQARDPLSAVFLMPLGLPWSLLAGRLPEGAGAIALILAPGLNLLVLALLCRASARRGPR